MSMLAVLVLALTLPAASPAPAAAAAVPLAGASAKALPARRPLAPVSINGVLFQAVEFDTGKVVWRNLAITVTSEHLDAWRSLSVAQKSADAQLMIDNYRAGMKFEHDIKLTFIDEHNTTLDQYLWTPATANHK